jgi:hypothetical protein
MLGHISWTSTSLKFFLKKLIELQNKNNVDLTGPQQHWLKNKAIAGLFLQSIISKTVITLLKWQAGP